MQLYLVLALLAASLPAQEAVDRSKFRTCADTGFCRRHRGATAALPGADSFRLDVESVSRQDGQLLGKVIAGALSLKLLISVCRGGAVRVKITEDEDRWAPPEILQPEGLEPGEFNLLSSGDAELPAGLRDLPSSSLLAIRFNAARGGGGDAWAIDDGPSVLAVHASPLKVSSPLVRQAALQPLHPLHLLRT